MTTIKSTCSFCGDVVLGPEDVTIILPREDAPEGQYRFKCPNRDCGAINARQANEKVVSVLLATGVQVEIEPPALTENDINDFVSGLTTENIQREIDSWNDEK